MIEVIFSDKRRLLKICFLLFLLVGLIFYAQIQGPKAVPGIKEFRKNPARFINHEIEFGGKIRKIDNESFIVEQIINGEKLPLPIKGNLENAKLGDNIYGVFVYQKSGELILNRYIISNTRPLKIAISFITALIVFYFFFQQFTFDFKKFRFGEKH